MALAQVRALFNGQWVTLAYNEATGRYEGIITPESTSFHQTGGYFSLSVEATNDNGETASISGGELQSLRLVVRETVSPSITLVSPPAGYLMTGTPTVVVEVVDEPGGSGVDPGSFSVAVDGGAAQTPRYEAIAGGYRVSFTPTWADGPHTITFSASDYDGNPATASAAYTVDTAPPVLIIRRPDAHRVVDVDSVEVAAEAWDITTPNVTVGVVNGDYSFVQPAAASARAAGPGTVVSFRVPLEVGENHIMVTATDGAGNQAREEVYMIRLITDRTQADVKFLEAIYQVPMEKWTEETISYFNESVVRGAYNAEDLNRVGAAVRYLSEELQKRGFFPVVQPKTDWTMSDAPTRSQGQTYRNNVEAIRTAQEVYISPEIPESVRKLNFEGANRIEKALVETDAVFPRYTSWTSGEIFCGEF